LNPEEISHKKIAKSPT